MAKIPANPSELTLIEYASTSSIRGVRHHKLESKEQKHLGYLYDRIKDQLMPCINNIKRERQIDGVIFTFHALIKKEEQVLNITGIEDYDQHNDEFPEMIGLHFQKSYQTNPNYLWILITNNGFKPLITDYKYHKRRNSFCIIDCELDTRELMFERVCAAFIVTKLIGKDFNIAYLDGDAFPMRSFDPIWNIKKDVLLTKRYHRGRTYVPINEGVFFVKRGITGMYFFDQYLKTYSILSQDVNLQVYYNKSIKRWRGGQLSLNVICNNYNRLEPKNKFSIEYLNCQRFNCFSKFYSPFDISKKYVIHVKGRDKDFELIRSTLTS